MRPNYSNTASILVLIFSMNLGYAQVYTSEVEVQSAANGNVGIGTTSPTQKLDVNGSLRLSSDLYLENTQVVYWGKDGGGYSQVFRYNYVDQLVLGQEATDLFLRTTSNLYQIVLKSGNVGVNETSPASLLHIYNSTVHTSARYANVLTVESARPSATNDNRLVGIALSFESDIHKSSQKAVGIFAQSKSAYANAVDMLFYTRTYSSSPYYQERMRLKHNGYLGIGYTSPSYKLDVNGSARASAWYTSSDERLKKNVRSLDRASELKRVRAYKYEMKDDLDDGRAHYGLMAQEIEEVYPDLVVTDSLGFKAVAYQEFIPILIEQTNQQQEIIKELQDQNAVLRSRIIAIEEKLK